jgi:ubiquitin C-terminal hydrolase
VFEQRWDPYFTTKLLQTMNTFEPNQSSSEYFLKLCDFLKLDDLFQNKTETVTICTECKNENKIIDISVYIVIDQHINECIETTRTIEGYQCDFCKKKVNATIISKLKETNEILIFTFNKYFQKNHIEYPLELKLESNYKLVSTIEHHGVLNAGHYFSRSVRKDGIFQCDDNNVQPISNLDSDINTYMIFYQKI